MYPCGIRINCLKLFPFRSADLNWAEYLHLGNHLARTFLSGEDDQPDLLYVLYVLLPEAMIRIIMGRQNLSYDAANRYMLGGADIRYE